MRRLGCVIQRTFREFLGQAWMKPDKNSKAPHIILMTKRFNDVSRLVASEILRRPALSGRVAAIEKWAAVADISRCLHNFNGVLQICSAFTNSAVYRLKKTWEKVSKTVSKAYIIFIQAPFSRYQSDSWFSRKKIFCVKNRT